MNLDAILKEVDAQEASDLYLIAGSVPCMSVDGQYVAPRAAEGKRLSPRVLEDFARSMMTPEQWAEFERRRELNMAFMADGVGRYRVNMMFQRGSIGMVMRRVVMKIPTLRDLELPPVLRDIALADRGIVLVTGATGSGKSTTMASMLDYRNHVRNGHIVTIEDPIEFVYQHRKSIVTQRELGMDTASFSEALRNSLRQAPSVISIGEMRDADTVQFALHAAETGHLVFATLHSTNALMALERVRHFFPAEHERQVILQMALNLKAIIAQRLVPRVSGGRAAACEVLINTPRCQDLIAKWEPGGIKGYIRSENSEGIQDFDRVLYQLHKRGIITHDDALHSAESASEMEMRLKGMGVTPGSSWEDMSDPWAGVTDPYAPPEITRGTASAQMQSASAYTNEGAELVKDDERGVSGIQPRQIYIRRASSGAPDTPGRTGSSISRDDVPVLSSSEFRKPAEEDLEPVPHPPEEDEKPIPPPKPKAPPHPRARVAVGPGQVTEKYKDLIETATAPTGDESLDSELDELDELD